MKTQEQILSELESIWNKSDKKQPKERVITGKGGAIAYDEFILGKQLTDEEKSAYKDGAYDIGCTDCLTAKFLR